MLRRETLVCDTIEEAIRTWQMARPAPFAKVSMAYARMLFAGRINS
jgi:hypothetical protein